MTLYEPDPARWIDFREQTKMIPKQKEGLVERRVTYALEFEGKLYIVQNVPARVDEETDEQFFLPSTVERLQTIILERVEPIKVIETPVYEYAE